MLKSLIATALIALPVTIASANDSVAITQAESGKTLNVKVTNVADGKVTFEARPGKSYTVALDTLTAKSQQEVEAFWKARAAEAGKITESINEAIGHNLIVDGQPVWNDPAADVAKRLRWPQESKTERSSSFRSYPLPKYRFLGARPFSATLYGGEDGNADLLSLVFANKGDFGSTVGRGEDHFTETSGDGEAGSLSDAMERDEKRITDELTKLFGEATKQRFGEKGDRRKVQRWDWNGMSFLLSVAEDEYCSLLITRTEIADAEGKTKFVKDSDLRAMLAKNVARKDNGDVLVTNLPMVDQGPKGYCAPATFERAMRYMRVPADMYLLATVATNPTGGTNTRVLADEAERIIRSKARSLKTIKGFDQKFKIRDLKKFIDKGVPVMWMMRSLDGYNKIANSRTSKRADVTDLDAWAAEIASEAEQTAPSFVDVEDNHHICLIIGYNEKTNEVAVSDSWGPRYELRWVHLDIARAVTSNHVGAYVISF